MPKVRGRYFTNGRYKQKTITMTLVTDSLGFVYFSKTADVYKNKIENAEGNPIRLIWTEVLEY